MSNINAVTISGTISASGEMSGTVQITGEPVLDTVTVKSTTTAQTVTPEAGTDGFSSITVSPISLQSKNVTPNGNEQVISADTGYDGLASVTVAPVLLQTKSVTPTSTAQTVTPDSGFAGLSSVTVGAAAGGDCVLDFSVSWQGVIEQAMFMDMTDITSVIFKVNHSNLEIKKWGFKNCSSLKRVEIPVCTNIGPNAFNGVTGHDLYVGASEPFGFTPIPIAQAYDIGEPRSIHCPPELVSAYKAHEAWGVWSSIIVGDYNWPY